MTAPAVLRFDDAESLARHGAEWLCARAGAEAAFGECAICLSGGSTPRRLYELLAEEPLLSRVPWHRIHWFFGDERFVPKYDPASNYRMVHEALLSRAPIADDHVHAVPTDLATPDDAARAYEASLRGFHTAVARGRPLFAATLLGLGKDGHTASLFPGNPALCEKHRWVVAVDRAAPQPRITLTLPALDSSTEAAFLVSGEEKKPILARILGGESDFPAARVHPVGTLHWFVDRAAMPDRADAERIGGRAR